MSQVGESQLCVAPFSLIFPWTVVMGWLFYKLARWVDSLPHADQPFVKCPCCKRRCYYIPAPDSSDDAACADCLPEKEVEEEETVEDEEDTAEDTEDQEDEEQEDAADEDDDAEDEEEEPEESEEKAPEAAAAQPALDEKKTQ
jgi:hypothetical protein